MIKTFKYRLYPAKRNKKLQDNINVACWVYNHCLALHKRYYRLYGKSLNKYKLQKHITKLKKRDKYKSWRSLNSQTIQDVTDRIERAYRLFFNNLKRHRPPKFKSRTKYSSFTLKQCGYKILEGNKIKIGGTVYKYWKSRDIEGEIKRLCVKRDNVGDFYIFLSCVVDNPKAAFKTGKIAGCDFGLKTFLTTSDSEKIESPQHLKQNLDTLRKRSKSLSKKKKGSRNRHKARLGLARCYRKISNQRRDFHFKTANRLLSEYDELYFEDLNLDGMKRLWGRKVSDLALDSFLKILEHKALETGKHIGYIDRWFPSSKICSREGCGILNMNLQLNDRDWECACGTFHDRDVNAATNILRVGASAHERDEISLTSSDRGDKFRCRRQESQAL